MAKTVNKVATAETAFGEPIKLANGDTSVTFEYSYPALESLQEVPADEQPTEKQILNLVNSLRNATARNKAQAVAFDAAGIKAPSVDPAESRRRMVIKALVAEGAAQDVAEQMADAMLGQFRNK